MLIPDSIHPETTVYYNGAKVLQVLRERRTQSVLDLYVAASRSRPMTQAMFVLCLDWLFLLNLIRLNEQGAIEPCF